MWGAAPVLVRPHAFTPSTLLPGLAADQGGCHVQGQAQGRRPPSQASPPPRQGRPLQGLKGWRPLCPLGCGWRRAAHVTARRAASAAAAAAPTYPARPLPCLLCAILLYRVLRARRSGPGRTPAAARASHHPRRPVPRVPPACRASSPYAGCHSSRCVHLTLSHSGFPRRSCPCISLSRPSNSNIFHTQGRSCDTSPSPCFTPSILHASPFLTARASVPFYPKPALQPPCHSSPHPPLCHTHPCDRPAPSAPPLSAPFPPVMSGTGICARL